MAWGQCALRGTEQPNGLSFMGWRHRAVTGTAQGEDDGAWEASQPSELSRAGGAVPGAGCPPRHLPGAAAGAAAGLRRPRPGL